MKLAIAGGGYITSTGWGKWSEGAVVSPDSGKVSLPSVKDVSPTSAARIGRFDSYTRMGWSTIALALADANLLSVEESSDIGVVLSTRYGCLETDTKYYETVLDGEGEYSSPNLFSYTLPNIILGEAAAHFKLRGSAFCVGETEKYGIAALNAAFSLSRSDSHSTMLAGWLESVPGNLPETELEKDAVSGCVIVVLDSDLSAKRKWLERKSDGFYINGTSRIADIFDIFGLR